MTHTGPARTILTDPARLSVLGDLEVEGHGTDKDFQTIAGLAGTAFDAPAALVFLAGTRRREILAAAGDSFGADSLDNDLVAETLARMPGEPHVVLNLGADGGTAPRFYAGAAIFVREQPVGVVCVIDGAARGQVADGAVAQLAKLAGLAASFVALKDSARQRQAAEIARRRAEFRQSLALRAASISSWMWTIKSDLVSYDETLGDWLGFERMVPVTMDEMLEMVDPVQKLKIRATLDKALADDVDFRAEFKLAGSDRWVLGLGRVYERAADGQPLSMAGVYVDISQTKQSEQATRILLGELNHRVKNTLAVLQSLAAQTLRRTQSPEDFMRAFSGRLQAMASAHNLLSDNQSHTVNLHALLRTLVAPYALNYEDNIVIEGADVPLLPDDALGLGLVVHELATNAARHGALRARSGKLTLASRVSYEGDQQVLHLTWMERGGPEVSHPRAKGLGSVLIERGLQKTLGSRVETRYEPEGLTAEIVLPVGGYEPNKLPEFRC